MLIILHDKEQSALDGLAELIGTNHVHYVDGPKSMEKIDEDVVDALQDGQSVLIVVPTHAIGVTYATIEECVKLNVPVWQLKASERKKAR